MSLDQIAVAYAFGAGAASFFSPCSTGLLPAYMGYYLSSGGSEGGDQVTVSRNLVQGLGLGAAAASGFLVLLLLAAGLVMLVPLHLMGPVLPYLALAVGAGILVLGALLFAGRGPRLDLHVHFRRQGAPSVFVFGVAYALASLGCTFPLFLSVVLGATATGSAAAAAVSLLAYAVGMGLVMIIITAALAVSRQGVARWIRQAVPVVRRAAAAAMMVAGGYLIWFWVDVLRQTNGV